MAECCEKKKKPKRKHPGFTLIELLAVVLILGILLSIAVMRYANSTATANERIFEGNHRICAVATVMYISDHSGGFPDSIADLLPYMAENPTGKPHGATYSISSGSLVSEYQQHRDADKKELVYVISGP